MSSVLPREDDPVPTTSPNRATADRGLSWTGRTIVLAVMLAPLLIGLGSRLVTARADGPSDAAPALPTVSLNELGLPKPLLGFAINAHHISDLELYLRSIDRISDLGANTLIVVTPQYQKKVDSIRIRDLRTRCPKKDQLIAILRRARERGMFTILMPIVLIEDAGDDDWRGVLRPDDWTAWWASYERFLDYFVDIANTADVGMLSIGSELNSTEDQLEQWSKIAARVRASFDGPIMYSANWDRYDKTGIWSHVDVLSVSAYFELERDRHDAPEADLIRAWQKEQRQLLDVAERWQRPLLLSEVGYPTLSWAAAHPWNYVGDPGMTSDPEAQARAWRSFFAAWTEVIADPNGRTLGVCGYRWDPYHRGGAEDTGYGIQGKPSHKIIRGGFRAIREKNRHSSQAVAE